MAKRKAEYEGIQPDTKNANKGTERGRYMVEASLRETGAGRSIVLDKDGRIIAGNKTFEAASDIGLPVRIVQTDGTELVAVQRTDLDLSDDTGAARRLAYFDNRAGQVGLEWDAEQILGDITAGLDLSAMFRQDELDELLADLTPKPTGDTEAQTDRAEELRQQWGVESGQMWQLGEHRLICGDCTDPATVAWVMGGEMAAICFTSPPYNAGKTPTEEKLGNERKYKDYSDDLPVAGYLELLCGFTDVALSVCEYAFVNLQMLSGNKLAVVDYLARYRLHLADVAIWDKQHAQPAMAENVMNSRFEFVFALSAKSNATRRLPGTFRGTVDNVYAGAPQRSNVVDSGTHSATMPLDFAEWPIKNFSLSGDLVYEPFSGSGTTAIACENLSRRCRAVEISPAYVAVALQRFYDHCGKLPVLVSSE